MLTNSPVTTDARVTGTVVLGVVAIVVLMTVITNIMYTVVKADYRAAQIERSSEHPSRRHNLLLPRTLVAFSVWVSGGLFSLGVAMVILGNEMYEPVLEDPQYYITYVRFPSLS